MSLYPCRILLIWAIMLATASKGNTQSNLRVEGLHRVGHSIESEMRYRVPHGAELSARYQLFIRNRATHPLTMAGNRSARINGISPDQWHAEGRLSWYRFPEQDTSFPSVIPTGALMVWQFNGKDTCWLRGGRFHLQTADLDTTLADTTPSTWIASLTCTGPADALLPSKATLHLVNDSDTEWQVDDMILWQPQSEGDWQFLFPGQPLRPSLTLPSHRRLRARGRCLLQFQSDRFRSVNTAIQLRLSDAKGARIELWAYMKLRKEAFDISGGWANGAIQNRPALINTHFRQTLQSLYVNTAHYTGQPGYSDVDSLFRKWPIKYFGHLTPWQRFDRDSLLPRIHGIEFLGEPQYGGGRPVDPQLVSRQLLPYAAARIPTTLTHSEERIWRFYAGLSDYPHFDAYRVSAPSADDWRAYDRWNGQRIGWGAPLETIGTMTRSLKALNRPLPIAYWSQGPHEGWEVYGGRRRRSPTASELRSQAYHALASGITSLYWFNLSYKSLRMFPELLAPMQRIGREVRLLEPFYLQGAQWYYKRLATSEGPDWDVSTFVAPDGILLFALDLRYRADLDSKTFVFTPDRTAALRFQVPDWVSDSWQLWKLEVDGLRRMAYTLASGGGLMLNDRITEVAIYVLLPNASSATALGRRWRDLLRSEANWPFNPAVDPLQMDDFLRLSTDGR
ncbi:MAG: hypothetical protein FJX89_05870 [Bacteroidetes bacterium]|nr:hypothetical protein [Bacteroidota bacterium]